ncbi:MAG: magnesium transporter [bacterium]
MKKGQKLLKELLTPILEKEDWDAFDVLMKRYFLQDIARLLKYFPVEKRLALLRRLGPARAGRVLCETTPSTCSEMTKSMSDEFLSQILTAMPGDDAADVLERLPDDQKERVFSLMDPAEAEKIRGLLKYAPDTAGGLMTHNFIAVNEKLTLEEAINEVREKAADFLVPRIFVVDDEGTLKGYIPSSRLLRKDTGAPLSEFMITRLVKATTDMDQEEVAEVFSRYDLFTLPVVDPDDRLVGLITVDDIVDVIHEEASEDALMMSGTHIEELESPSVMRVARARVPWLFASWMGGIAALLVIGRFENALRQAIVLSAFIPVIMGMGGNAGIQSATVIVRGLAIGYIHTGDVLTVLFREIRVGIILGLSYGALLGVITQARYFRDFHMLGAVVGLSIMSAMALGVMVGTFFPMFFKRINIDPAIATGPFVTATLDICGITVYFTLARLIMGL